MSQLTKQDILNASGFSVPLKMNGGEFFEQCKKTGFSRYIVAKHLLEVSNTTGRTISLSDEYIIEIDEDFEVSINKVTPIK